MALRVRSRRPTTGCISQLDAVAAVGAPFVELHTGAYANATGTARERELERLAIAARHAVAATACRATYLRGGSARSAASHARRGQG